MARDGTSIIEHHQTAVNADCRLDSCWTHCGCTRPSTDRTGQSLNPSILLIIDSAVQLFQAVKLLCCGLGNVLLLTAKCWMPSHH